MILGPTAAGKSRVAIELAERLGGEVVVADSRQVYRRLEIATNKPAAADRARVRIHGLDLAEPDTSFNVHDYVGAMTPILDSVPLPIMEGGSNLYVAALMDGLTLTGVPPDRGRRAELEKLPPAELAGLVRALDPGAELDFHNPVRLVRAIEVLEALGPPLAAARRRSEPRWRALRIGLQVSKEVLFERIAVRSQEQVRRGLVAETRAALAAGVAATSQALSGTGYREAVAHLEGRVALADLPQLMALNNRRLAKRQLTWLRRDGRIRWFPADEDPLPAILIYLETHLN